MHDLVKQYLYIFNAKQKKALLFLLFGLVICAVLDALAVALMGSFTILLLNVDAVFNDVRLYAFYQFANCRSASQFLIMFALIIASIYLLRGVLRFYLQYKQAIMIGQYRAELSNHLFTKVVMQPYNYHVKHNSSQLQQLLTEFISNTFSLLDNVLLAVAATLVGVCFLVVLLLTNWAITLAITLFLLLVLFITNRYIKKYVQDTATEYNKAFGCAIKWIYQTLGAIKDIIAKNSRPFFIDEYSKHAKTVAMTYARYYTWQSAPKFIIETMVMVGVFLATAVIIQNGQNATKYLPILATFALAATRLIPTFSQLSTTLSLVAFCKPAVGEVYHALTEDASAEGSRVMDADNVEAKSPLKDSIQIDNICFSFEDSDAPLLHNVSVRIKIGQSIAFIGPSGSGKTTLADIILGVYKPDSGRITADAVDIHRNPKWWSRKIGYIPQYIYLCDDSIRANVAFGFAPDMDNDAKIWQCLGKAQMKEFVESLPEQLDTNIGDNGVRLSGGQRQRIGIARALFSDPEVLVMDEATSSLDPATEAAIIQSVNALAGEKTLIIIAHRLTTIEGCDHVYRVEGRNLFQEH